MNALVLLFKCHLYKYELTGKSVHIQVLYFLAKTTKLWKSNNEIALGLSFISNLIINLRGPWKMEWYNIIVGLSGDRKWQAKFLLLSSLTY